MTRLEANALLDKVREGQPVPWHLVLRALALTGDAPAGEGLSLFPWFDKPVTRL